MIFFKNIHQKFLQHRDSLLLLGADLLLVMLAYGGFYRPGYCADTVWHMIEPRTSIETWLKNGRYLACALSSFLMNHGFLATDHYIICFGIFLIFLTLAIFFFQQGMKRGFSSVELSHRELPTPDGFPVQKGSIPLQIVFVLCTALPFINVLFTENFMFTECFLVFPFGYFLAALAFYAYTAADTASAGLKAGARRSRIPGAVLLMLLAAMFYQNSCILMLIFISAYQILRAGYRLSWTLILKEVVTAVAVVGLTVAEMKSVDIFVRMGLIIDQQKETSVQTILNNLGRLPGELRDMLCSSAQLLPPVWLPLLMLIGGVGLLLIQMLCSGRGRDFILVLLFIAEGFLMTFLFPVLGGGFNPRLTLVFYGVIGLTVLMAAGFAGSTAAAIQKGSAETTEKSSTSGPAAGLSALAIILFMAVQIIFCNVIMSNHYISNTLDELYSQQVLNRIYRYEAETGETVRTIAITFDTYAEFSYPQVRYHRDQINERVISMSPYCLIEILSGDEKNFETTREIDPEIQAQYFEGKNWDEFVPDEQIVFKGDTCYWCIF